MSALVYTAIQSTRLQLTFEFSRDTSTFPQNWPKIPAVGADTVISTFQSFSAKTVPTQKKAQTGAR
jgi:hypothetical protein